MQRIFRVHATVYAVVISTLTLVNLLVVPQFYWFEFPVFNVADCGLVVGAGLLFVQAMFAPPEEKKNNLTAENAEIAEKETSPILKS